MPDALIRYETVPANGLRFNVAACGTGDRLALCLHGFPESSFSFRHQLPLLAKLGYRAWAPDLRGYGKTSRPVGVAEYTMDKLMADVAGLIDASGAREVLLVGHDWGGAIAWSFALTGQRPLERLIIMNCPHPTCFVKGLRTWKQLRKSWYMFFFQIPWLSEALLGAREAEGIGRAFSGMALDKSRFPDEVLRVYRDNAREPGALTAMLNFYRALFRGAREASRRTFPELTVPTLLVWGEVDTALGKELTFDTARYVRELTIRYLPGVSHWVQQEAPETVNRMIDAWLRGAAVPEAAPPSWEARL
jgi:pimeloyl-ACP methyl ester carboxylesterase